MPSPIRFIEIFLCSIVGFLPCIMVLIYPCRDRLRLNSALTVILTLLLAALQLGTDLATALELTTLSGFVLLAVWFFSHLIYGILMLRVPFGTLLLALLPGLGLSMAVKIGSGLITNIALDAREFTFYHLGVMAAMEIIIFGVYLWLLRTHLASIFVPEPADEAVPEAVPVPAEASPVSAEAPAPEVTPEEEPKPRKSFKGLFKSKTAPSGEPEEIAEEAIIKEAPVPEVKEEPRTEIREEPKPEVKEEPETEVKEEVKSEEPQPEVKVEPKPEVKEEPKKPESDSMNISAARLQTLQYSDLMERIAESNWIRQEFRRHVDALNYRLGKKQYEKLQTHLNALQRQFPKDAPPPYCDYAPLNPVLAYFSQQAAYCGAVLKTDVSLPAELSITEKDLVTLIGNLLNNAVDACKKQRSGDRKISITIGIRNSILKLTAENTFDISLRKDESANYISDKYEEEGMGLMVCRQIVRNYQGKLDISDADGLFKVTVFLKL